MSKKQKITVTNLAKLGVCEKQIVLQINYGKKATKCQQAQMDQGSAVHEQHYSRVKESSRNSACFIATAVYGADAYQTEKLRDYRDSVLLKTAVGRLFVRLYYRTSPPIAFLLNKCSLLKSIVRRLLDCIVGRL